MIKLKLNRMQKSRYLKATEPSAPIIHNSASAQAIQEELTDNFYADDEVNEAATSRDQVQDEVGIKRPTLREKLRDWVISNTGKVHKVVVDELLQILNEEPTIESLPSSTASLLKISHTRKDVTPMASKRGTIGAFAYLGLEKNLQARVPENYVRDTVKILVNIDGAKCYVYGKTQLWPILVKVVDELYESDVFVCAVFCGDSKPGSLRDYLRDFVKECNRLHEKGLHINSRILKFEILAFICDTPARAYLKCVKGHAGFYSCERCNVKGLSVGKKRIFQKTNAAPRSHATFKVKKHKKF